MKKILSKKNANQLIKFFSGLIDDVSYLTQWSAKLKSIDSDWDFISTNGHSNNFSEQLIGNKEPITVWSPYFAADTIGLCNKFFDKGINSIELVPDINVNGKIRIINQQLNDSKSEKRISFLRRNQIEENPRLYHAKVWITSKKIAVGSWNFSYRATGLSVAAHEQNMEAGIISNLTRNEREDLKKELVHFENKDIKGSEADEINNEWDQVLNLFSFSCVICADWRDFKYSIANEYTINDFTVSLPHRPEEHILLCKLNTLSFRDKFRRLLKNKAFTVFDAQGIEVFQGYLVEQNTERRPVYGYSNIYDLMDSLIENPSGDGNRKKLLYAIEEVQEKPDEQLFLFDEQRSSDSYYKMFVSFQRLLNLIEQAKGNEATLDKIGFRFPGSLVNIISLVEESVENSIEKNLEDSLLFHWFLVQEVNRCLNSYNLQMETARQRFGLMNTTALEKKLSLEEADRNFITRLNSRFNYVAK